MDAASLRLMAAPGKLIEQLKRRLRRPGDTRAAFLALSEHSRRYGSASGNDDDLTRYELRVLSQNGEDGVIAEILARIGAGNRSFVEFGIGPGVQGNCVLLAEAYGWSGTFIESDPDDFNRLAERFAANRRVNTLQEQVTPSRVEEIFSSAGVDPEPTIISIDIDGQDYWVWEQITNFSPRLVVIEYNGTLDPGRALVEPRGRHRTGPYDLGDDHGASVEALRRLGEAKGYRLVHTDLCGVNAFFVRDDLAGPFPAIEVVPRRTPNFRLVGEGPRRVGWTGWTEDPPLPSPEGQDPSGAG